MKKIIIVFLLFSSVCFADPVKFTTIQTIDLDYTQEKLIEEFGMHYMRLTVKGLHDTWFNRYEWYKFPKEGEHKGFFKVEYTSKGKIIAATVTYYNK